MWVRMSTFQGPAGQSAEQVEETLARMRKEILPAARSMDGFKGVVSFGDPASGKSVTLTFWDSEDALSASEEAANALRDKAAQVSGDDISGIERFEVQIYDPPRD